MSRVAEPRPFPLEALVELVDVSTSVDALAARLGVTRRSLYRWRAVGLTDVQADELAVRLGLHPAIVWRDW